MTSAQIPTDHESLLALYLDTRRAVDGLRQAAEQGLNFGFCEECDLPVPDGQWSPVCDGCQPERYVCDRCMPEGFGMTCEGCCMAACVRCSQNRCWRCEQPGCVCCLIPASVRRGMSTPSLDDPLECAGCYGDWQRIHASIEAMKSKPISKAKSPPKRARKTAPKAFRPS